ncbi:Mu transposase C-terminal domain-containing protein [Longivirga aurantiaca]|uniref:Mu transposase C-terminal domain-containing protein n=1 Tax=Longivirga aurantiaca TaxID=1837743 RepID=A0ABW1SZZ8_9ACTN
MSNKPALHRDGRDRVIAELFALEAAGVDLDGTLFSVAAEASGYSVRHLRRLVAALRAARHDRELQTEAKDGWLLDGEVVNEVARCSGNLAKAYRNLKATKNLPSLATFQRKVNSLLGQHAMTVIRHGDGKARSRRVYLKRDPGERGHTYETDHTECPIYVIPTGHKRATRPYITVVVDHATRYVLSLVITFGTPSAEEVRVAFISAILERTAADGHTRVGGLPFRIVWDQGKDFLSTLVTESCLRLGTTPSPLPPYSPNLKGRCERFWRTFKGNCLASLPGYIDSGTDVRGTLHRAQYALSEVAFVERVTAWLDWYNTEHVVRTLGMTPLQAWQADPRDLVTVPADQLWCDFLLSDSKATVSVQGVRWKSLDYVTLHGELDRLIGKQVEVRYLPHMRDFIEVFHDGKHVGTAYPSDHLQPEDQEAFLKQRRADQARALKNVSSVKRIHKQDPDTSKLHKRKLPGGKFAYEVDVPDDDLRTGQSDALDSYRPRRDDNGFDEHGQGLLV